MSDDVKKDGGPAFPLVAISESTGQPINGFFSPGMSKREWFAGMALQGIITGCFSGRDGFKSADIISSAYVYADAMIAQGAENAKA